MFPNFADILDILPLNEAVVPVNVLPTVSELSHMTDPANVAAPVFPSVSIVKAALASLFKTAKLSLASSPM